MSLVGLNKQVAEGARVRISADTSATLTDILLVFPQSPQGNALVPQIRPQQTQPVCVCGGKARPARKANNFTAICEPIA
jgi:hypothetical protein